LVCQDETRLHIALIRGVNNRTQVTALDIIIALEHGHQINFKTGDLICEFVPKFGPHEFRANKWNHCKRGRAKFQNQEISST
jgi:hypothetical protein